MKFTYGSGQRPLDGYTIKRGVGHGGFGEVYFAVSDGGKEVALKLVKGNSPSELRGMAQCLNLKHPNLVALYDLRTDGDGQSWVVMEYISGEPLSLELNRHPNGLPRHLAVSWFTELARAVGHLHEHGIVHRDLKPANIFIENGMVKVGDYGLCKSMSSSQRSAQTQSVGTVHYMAPEISTGNYNRQIDIYACGVLLYEMITGRVPFEGESAGEILMKHLTSPPDLNVLPVEFRPVVGQALAKNPVQRYATMPDMAQAVEAVVHGAPTVTPVPVVPVAVTVPGLERRPDPPLPRRAEKPKPPVVIPVAPRSQVGELAGSLALTAVLAAVTTVLWVAVSNVFPLEGRKAVGNALVDLPAVGSQFFLTLAVCWAVLIPAKVWTNRGGDSWGRRLVMVFLGIGVGGLALWLDGWVPPTVPISHPAPEKAMRFGSEALAAGAGYLSYFGLNFGLMRWWRMTDRRRKQWFSFFPVLAAGFWALVLAGPFWPHQVGELNFARTTIGIAALITASLIVQWVSPWEAPPPPLPRRLKWRPAV